MQNVEYENLLKCQDTPESTFAAGDLQARVKRGIKQITENSERESNLGKTLTDISCIP